MEKTYTIGRLARAAEVPVSTVRYYENRGLLEPEARTEGNYRVYGPASLKRLRFIRASQESGFTLEDIRLLLRLQAGNVDACGSVRTVIEKRLEAIRQKLEDLERARQVLEGALRWCKRPQTVGRCKVLDDLDFTASQAATEEIGSRTSRRRRPPKRC